MRLGDLDALKEDFKSRLANCNEWIEKAKDKETKIRASTVKAFIGEVIMTIDNVPTVNPFFPFSEEVIYKITDAEWEHSDNFWITTPSGKKIEFEKKRQDEWIPIKLRPGTDEEYEAFSQYGDCPREDFRVFECPLPDDNQEVLVTTRWGDVCIDIWHRDVDCCYFENNSDDDDVIAWMPLPEKYNSEVKEE